MSYNDAKILAKKDDLSVLKLKVAHFVHFKAISETINVLFIEPIHIFRNESHNDRGLHR